MSLTDQLNQTAQATKKAIPENILKIMEDANSELIEKEIGQNSIKNGERFPNASLLNTKGDEVRLSDLFNGKDFLILSFYRGGWCPYCNLELKSLQDSIEGFNSARANLVAITPELPDYSLATAEKNNIKFEVLTDKDSMLSKEIGIAFDMPDSLKPIYDQFGLDVKAHNGNFTLPLPGTFIIDSNLSLLYSFIDIDYKKRLDPKDILDFLNKNQKKEV